jgi:hypothetical protein
VFRKARISAPAWEFLCAWEKVLIVPLQHVYTKENYEAPFALFCREDHLHSLQEWFGARKEVGMNSNRKPGTPADETREKFQQDEWNCSRLAF